MTKRTSDSSPADITTWFGELARRRVFQVLALYVAFAWGFTEIFTTVSETLGWPLWTRMAVVVLFILGFPAVMLLAWLFDVGPDGVRRARPDSRTGRLFIGTAVAAIAATTILVVVQLQEDSGSADASIPTELTPAQWAKQVATPEIERLVEAQKLVQAFDLARQALDVLPKDPRLLSLAAESAVPVKVTSAPLGATVSVKPYDAPDSEWLELGVTPFSSVPAAELRWKFEKDGFVTREIGRHPYPADLHLELHRRSEQRSGMVHIAGGIAVVYDGSVQRGPDADLEGFWIDQHETTNAEYREFLRSDAWRSQELWTSLLKEIESTHTLEDIQYLLVDTTGRAGPSTWVLGDYPEGAENDPVQGVSWIEAAAYCRFREKSLPTVFHFAKAGEQEALASRIYAGELLASNFNLKSVRAVSDSTALGPFGTYDLMGNVAEWAWNADLEDLRFLSGASFSDPEYVATSVGTKADPLQRSGSYGIRCISSGQEPGELQANIAMRGGSAGINLEPVNSDVFAVLRRQYEYDPAPLNPETSQEPTSFSDWRLEVVTIDTAYGERMDVHLYLPNNSKPPYQTVLFFPSSGAHMKSEIGSAGESSWIYFVPRSGRALVVPNYAGMYSRLSPYPDSHSRAKVQLVIRWAQDLMRTMDYLETRDDVDTEKVAYYGFSLGATYGPVFTALEQRFAASVLISGGSNYPIPEEHRPANFAPYVSAPTLMIGGRNDPQVPIETYQRPMLELLGAEPQHKKLYEFDGGHAPSDWNATVREILAWMDQYLGAPE